MAVTAAGFDGSVVEADWALLANNSGARYAVGGATDWQVTPRTGATLTSNVAAGVAFGSGVRVTSDAQQTVTHATLSTGTRWDAVVLRRDWSGTGGSAALAVITGTSTRAIPAGRFNAPGVKDDQVLGLIQITAGNPVPTAVVDLRWWPSKVITCYDLMAIADPVVGMEAVVLGVGTAPDSRWRYELDANSTAAWARDDTVVSAYPYTLIPVWASNPTGWASGGMVTEAGKIGNLVNMYVEIRCGTDTAVDASGGVTDTYIGTVDSSLIPDRNVPFPFIYRSASATSWSGVGEVRPDGTVYVVAASPNVPIAAQPFGTWSLRFNATYTVRN